MEILVNKISNCLKYRISKTHKFAYNFFFNETNSPTIKTLNEMCQFSTKRCAIDRVVRFGPKWRHIGPDPPENCHLTVKKLPKT